MGIKDWLNKLLKGGEVPSDPEEQARLKRHLAHLQRSGGTAANHPDVPGYRRQVRRDDRLLPKEPPKNYWERPDPVMGHEEAARSFSPSFRTRNRAIRSLVADTKLLKERGLPPWNTELHVARALDLTLGRLWWLAAHRFDDTITHYVQFRVPKRSGGHRVIMAPKRELKSIQRALLDKMVRHLPVSDHAHGFVEGRSVKTNAVPHVDRRVVLRFDLEDFFGTVTFGRVRGYLIAMGYGFDVATVVALLTTEAERQPVEVDEGLRYVPVGHRYCVQGAPTSPAICNAIAHKLDRRLAGLAESVDFAYTRYADDMTFSGDDEDRIGLFLRAVRDIVEDEGFRLNDDKTRVMRSGGSQKVTGVTVNETLGLSRKERRKIRAMIHRLETERDAGNADPAELDILRGKLAWVRMLNPDQADALQPDWLL